MLTRYFVGSDAITTAQLSHLRIDKSADPFDFLLYRSSMRPSTASRCCGEGGKAAEPIHGGALELAMVGVR